MIMDQSEDDDGVAISGWSRPASDEEDINHPVLVRNPRALCLPPTYGTQDDYTLVIASLYPLVPGIKVLEYALLPASVLSQTRVQGLGFRV
jgi:hypothetical protein